MWPFNRGWPLNGGPLNRGFFVSSIKLVVTPTCVRCGVCPYCNMATSVNLTDPRSKIPMKFLGNSDTVS